jgi:DNA-binding transcriptional LysR family regulator
VRDLERDFGVALVRRGRTRLELTPAGAALLTEGRAVLARLDRTAEVVRQAAAGHTLLAVGYVPPADVSLLPALTRAAETDPGEAALQLHLLRAPDIVTGIRHGRLALGLARFPPAAPDVHRELLSRDEVVVGVSPAHRLATAQTVELGDLAGETILLRPGSDGYNQTVLGALHDAGVTDPAVRYSRTAGNPSLHAAERGDAVVLLDRHMRSRAPGLVLVPVTPPTPLFPMHLLYRTGEEAAAVLRAADILRTAAHG